MIVLRIEHQIPNYEGWKKAFDSDPVNRKQAGVKSYRIFKPINDSKYIIVDLEFDNLQNAENMLSALQGLWKNVDGKIIFNPKTQILDLAENTDL